MASCCRCAEPFCWRNPTLRISVTASGTLCGRCLKHPPAFDRTLCPLLYEFPVNWLIQNYKHHFDGCSFNILSELLLRHLQQHYGSRSPWPQLLIPVPLHPKRRFERGFDQAAELVQRLGNALDLPVNTLSCKRRLDTPQQQGLDAKQRRRNLRHAFEVDADSLQLHSKISHVGLIDDVMTTGSTAQALSRKLKAAGVEQIDIWCLARTPRERIKGI
ncbi:ComF family protein [Motiliproteus coralliicola]|nr:ComF family protein [Motiliproteus coralliicola]